MNNKHTSAILANNSVLDGKSIQIHNEEMHYIRIPKEESFLQLLSMGKSIEILILKDLQPKKGDIK